MLVYARSLAEQVSVLLDRAATRLSRLLEAQTEHSESLHKALDDANAGSLEELLKKRTDTDYALLRAHADREQAEKELPEVNRIEQELETVRGKREAYDELHSLLASGKFIAYAVRRRQLQLLGVASDIFAEMTDGNYGFAEDFEVIHRPTLQQRASKTLSGGETFLASLSLALGLMEIAGRSGGRLEAFFLDEGFGSLDPNTLDRALTELERRSQGGRMVALVSHVPEVADYIRGHGSVLRVRRDETGSSVAEFDEEFSERQLEDHTIVEDVS